METIEAKDVKVLSIADPQFTTMDLNVAWNESELERSAKLYAERFKGLLVTEDNLDEMKHAAMELTHTRKKLDKFRTEGRKQLQKPVEQFTAEVDYLKSIITGVENPLRAQLNEFEQKRIERLREAVKSEYQKKASAMGLDAARFRYDFPDKIYNKTAKWADICNIIDEIIKNQLIEQKQDDDREEMLDQKKEMLSMYILMLNEKYRLATPLSFERIFTSPAAFEFRSIKDLKQEADEAFSNQSKIEQAAKETAGPNEADKHEPEAKANTISENTGNKKTNIILVRFTVTDPVRANVLKKNLMTMNMVDKAVKCEILEDKNV